MVTFSFPSLIHGNYIFHTRLNVFKKISYLKGFKFISYSIQIWSQYHLDNKSKGPPNCTLDPIIVWNLYKY